LRILNNRDRTESDTHKYTPTQEELFDPSDGAAAQKASGRERETQTHKGEERGREELSRR